MPVRIRITEGTSADCKEAIPLIEGVNAEWLLTDKAYDTDKIIEYLEKNDIAVVIPSKKNRKIQRDHDAHIYKMRHLVENAFLHLKR